MTVRQVYRITSASVDEINFQLSQIADRLDAIEGLRGSSAIPGLVSGGDDHDHVGGDGAQIDHGGLSGLTDDDHTSYLTTGRHDVTARHPDAVLGGDWTDYSATSTIVGWSSFTTKYIVYRKIGKLVCVVWELIGTSDATTATFTLPTASRAAPPANWHALFRGKDNDSFLGPPALAELGAASSTMNLYPTTAGGTWTDSGTKGCSGQMFYQVA